MKEKINSLKEARKHFKSDISHTTKAKERSEQIVVDFSSTIKEIKEPLLSSDAILVSQDLLNEIKISDNEIDNLDIFKNVNQSTAETIEIIGEPQKCCSCELY
jgi:hypothetical protein